MATRETLGSVQRAVLGELAPSNRRMVNLGWGHRVSFCVMGGAGYRPIDVPARVAESLIRRGFVRPQERFSRDWVITGAGRKALGGQSELG